MEGGVLRRVVLRLPSKMNKAWAYEQVWETDEVEEVRTAGRAADPRRTLLRGGRLSSSEEEENSSNTSRKVCLFMERVKGGELQFGDVDFHTQRRNDNEEKNVQTLLCALRWKPDSV